MLQIKDLNFIYDKHLYKWDLDILKGSRVAVQGPSGIGKTTFLSIIAGLIAPHCGSIFWNHQDLISLSSDQRPIAYLSQSNHTFDHLSVFDNIKLGIYSQPKHKRSKLIKSILPLIYEFQMNHLAKTPLYQISGGQKQRVALMRIIIQNRKIWLLDEPFNGLDDATKIIVYNNLKHWQKACQATIIFTTHHDDDTEQFATHFTKFTQDHFNVTNSCLIPTQQAIV